ncbi:hypothetical protein BH09BAC5_BH09BAC5_10790 [soil metagenome]
MARISVFLLFILFAVRIQAQTGTTKQLFIHFDTYNVQEDKLVQESLRNEHVVYSCIPAGILVIEVSNDTKEERERISALITKITMLSSFSFLDNYSLHQAESECSGLRIPN